VDADISILEVGRTRLPPRAAWLAGFVVRLRWTEEAANDLERIADYLLAHMPERPELIRFVYDSRPPLDRRKSFVAQREMRIDPSGPASWD
jgi:hypothetical protein